MNSSRRTPYDKDAYNISQRPKELVRKMMSLVDEAYGASDPKGRTDNKEKLQENDYLDMCKFLKTVYELDSDASNSSSSDSDNDDNDSDRLYVIYRVSLNEDLYNVGSKNYEMINTLMGYILENKIYIFEGEDDIENYYDIINNHILILTIDRFDIDAVKELVEKLGGEEECIKLLKYYKKENERFIQKVINKDFEEEKEIAYYRCLAFYGMHQRTFDWEYVDDGTGYSPSYFIENLLKIA
jgi:hypothetical protein